MLADRGHAKEAAEALKRALMAAGTAPSPAIALRVASAATAIDLAIARAAVQVALSRTDLDAAARRQAESIRDSIAAKAAPARA